MHAFLTLLLLATTLAADIGLIRAPERDVVKKEYAVSPGGTLHVEMDRGNIEVETTDKDRVFIELRRSAKADSKEKEAAILDAHEYDFDKRRNDVYIRTRFRSDRGAPRLRRGPRLRINLIVRVPEHYHVSFRNGAGNVEIMDVNGNMDGQTGAGNIELDDVTGMVNVKSGAGNVEVSGEVSSIDVNTGAGNIELFGLQGSVSAATGAGNIEAVIVRQPHEDSELSTGAGNVVVALAEDISVDIHATTSMGSADCEFPLPVSKNFLSRSFSGAINGGGARIQMRAGMGNVTLKRHRGD